MKSIVEKGKVIFYVLYSSLCVYFEINVFLCFVFNNIRALKGIFFSCEKHIQNTALSFPGRVGSY